MQIFSPYPDFEDIVNCLDLKRLNKQKVEMYQILNCVSKGDGARGWKNHPAVSMVRGYELFFVDYSIRVANRCLQLGFKDTLIPKFQDFKKTFEGRLKIPFYWGDDKFHSSHRSNLIRKDPIWYGKFGWAEPNDLPYYWPVK